MNKQLLLKRLGFGLFLLAELVALAFSLMALTYYVNTYSWADRDEKVHRWIISTILWLIVILLTLYAGWRWRRQK